VVASVGLTLHYEHQRAAKALAKADASYAQYQDDKKKLTAQITSDQDTIIALSKQQVQKQVIIERRDTAANKQVAQVEADVTNEDVWRDSTKFLGATPTIEPDNDFGFTMPQVKDFIKTKIEHDEFKADNEDLKTSLEFAGDKETLLQNEIDSYKHVATEADNVAMQYRSAARGSKWKTFRHRLIEGAVIVGAYEVGSHSR
jgi:hypothetical protein